MRFRVEPRDIPTAIAARRLGLTEAEFLDRLPRLLHRGFPPADETTGNYDLDAIDQWRKLRNPHIFGLTATPNAAEVSRTIKGRLAAMGNG